jgi:hypothetical protein
MVNYKEPGYNEHPVFPYGSVDSINTHPDFVIDTITTDEKATAQAPTSKQSTAMYQPPISILESRKKSAFHTVQSEIAPQQTPELTSAYTKEPDMIYQSAHTPAAYQREQENPFAPRTIEHSPRPLRDIVAKRLTHAANVLASATNSRIGSPLVRFAFDKIPASKKTVAKHRLEKTNRRAPSFRVLSSK